MEFNICTIQQKNGVWKDVSKGEYEIKLFNAQKNNPKLHLVYNNQTTIKLKYICDNCGAKNETSWRKFVKNQINNNKCLCHKCTCGSDSIRKKTSEAIKEAMKSPEVKRKHKESINKYWNKVENREKRSNISKELMKNEELRKLVSDKTKKAMENPEVRKLISNKRKEQMNDLSYREYLKEKRMNNLEYQENFINTSRNRMLKRKSSVQQMVYNYINNIKGIKLKEEYPINLYNCNEYHRNFILIDMCIPEKKIAIEVLGKYFHKGFVELLFENKSEKDILCKYEQYPDEIEGFYDNLKRHNYLTTNNWKVFYITDYQIMNQNWIEMIDKFLNENSLI